MKYVFGILIIALGVLFVIKTDWFIQNFGRSEWAEDKLGGGGTRLFYKLIGIIAIILSLMGMTGALGEVILSILGPLFGIKK